MNLRFIPMTLLATALCQTAHSQEFFFDVNGANGGQKLGNALLSLEDISGDGAPDFAIASALDDGAGGNSGRVELYDGISFNLLFSIQGFGANQELGRSMAQISDITGDSFPELVIGAAGGDGFVGIYNGISGSLINIIQGSMGEARGFSVAALPDIDGDGQKDFAVGSPLANSMGQVDVYSGQSGAVITTLLGTNNGGQFGFSLSVIQDADGDGLADLLVGEPSSSVAVNRGGSVYLYSARTGSLIRQIDGTLSTGNLGFSVIGLPDITGDGRPEFAAGAPGSDFLDGNNGAVIVFNGNDFLPPVYTFTGTFVGSGSGEELGASLATLDFNGDGSLDLAAGAPNTASDAQRGAVWIFSLERGCLIYQIAANTGDTDRFGTAIASGGDLDGDGFDDLLVGDPEADNAGTSSGRAMIFTGDDLHLNVYPRSFFSGAEVDVTISERPFLTPFLLVVVAFNGSPVFSPFVSGAFPGTGCFQILDASTAGFPTSTSITVRPFSLDNGGNILVGNAEVIRAF